jgi:hypothetical protein
MSTQFPRSAGKQHRRFSTALCNNNSDSGSTKLSKGLALTMKAGDVLGDRQSSVIVTVIE